MAKKRIAEKTERVSRDAVSGKLEVTVLDDVQKAFERVVQVIDAKMLGLGAADRDRLAHMLLERIGRMLPHTEAA